MVYLYNRILFNNKKELSVDKCTIWMNFKIIMLNETAKLQSLYTEWSYLYYSEETVNEGKEKLDRWLLGVGNREIKFRFCNNKNIPHSYCDGETNCIYSNSS
jgi:hypothetical protein